MRFLERERKPVKLRAAVGFFGSEMVLIGVMAGYIEVSSARHSSEISDEHLGALIREALS